jgi:hypothetical protein
MELTKSMHVSIIYLGDELPTYLIQNLKYLNRTFPNEQIVFISDSDKSVQIVSSLGIRTWKFQGLTKIIETYRKSLRHDWAFRSNFWFKTLARYFAIDAYMSEHPDHSHLHLEADNFLFPNFPFEYFRNNESQLAFPMESDEMGVASVLFIPNTHALKVLIDTSVKEISDNPFATDMTILGKIANSDEYLSSKLRVLPKELQDSLKATNYPSFFSSAAPIPGVFDAISHGQFLLGVDPRNFRGIRKVFAAQASHAVNPAEIIYQVKSKNELCISQRGDSWPIYNLHNHAKDLRLYSENKRLKLLTTRIGQIQSGERNEFLLPFFLKALFGALKRRFARVFRNA